MTSKRLHVVLVSVIVLMLAGLIGGTYAINKLLSAKADKLTQLKAKSLALDQEQQIMKKAQKDVKTYSDLRKIAQAVVPEDKDQAQAVREIVNIADANGVSLESITFPASTLGSGVAAQGSANSASRTPSKSASAKSSKLSQVKPVKNIAGVYELPITVKGDSNRPVQYDKFVNFLRALERNRRTAQVSSISIEPDSKNSNLLTFTLNLNEYIKP